MYQEDLRDSDQSELYGYDSRDRLTDWERGELNADKDAMVTTEADQTWNLDPVGNWDLTTTDGTPDDRDHNVVNELIDRDDGGVNLIYDDNGNLTDDGEYEYAYDAFNRLKTVTRKSDDSVIAEYTYDTQNRRVSKEVTNSSGLNGTTEYVYDGWQVVEERDGSGSVEKTYTYGSYIDEPVTMTNVGSTGSPTYYYHTNNLYNVRALTDGSGDVVERYRYGAYGDPTIYDDQGNEIQSSTVANPYMFQGRRMDTETGLYYYRNRYYSAQLGRFVTRDPMGYVDGYNLYEYVNGRPVLFWDPMGRNIFKKALKHNLQWATNPGQAYENMVRGGREVAHRSRRGAQVVKQTAKRKAKDAALWGYQKARTVITNELRRQLGGELYAACQMGCLDAVGVDANITPAINAGVGGADVSGGAQILADCKESKACLFVYSGVGPAPGAPSVGVTGNVGRVGVTGTGDDLGAKYEGLFYEVQGNIGLSPTVEGTVVGLHGSYSYSPDGKVKAYSYGAHGGFAFGSPFEASLHWQIQGFKKIACVTLPDISE